MHRRERTRETADMTPTRPQLRTLWFAGFALVSATAAQAVNPPLQPAFIDRSVSPCANFYSYANGAWQRSTKIPASRSQAGVNLEVDNQIRADVASILGRTVARRNRPTGSLEQQVGDLYASALDTKSIGQAGTRPLRPLLAQVERLRSTRQFASIQARLNRSGVDGVFGLSVYPDLRTANVATLFLDTAGLTLPERGFYLKRDKESVAIRRAYEAYLAKAFRLVGDDTKTARREAAAATTIETRLARATLNVEQSGQANRYRDLTPRALARLAPRAHMTTYLEGLGVPRGTTRIAVNNPRFLRALNATLRLPASTWRSYLRLRVIRSLTPLLDARFRRADFEFFGRVLEGLTSPESRSDIAGAAVDATLSDALGQLYTQKVFPPAAKAQVLTITRSITEALRADIGEITWMSPSAKAEAYRKLDTLHVKIGYPDKWRKYAGLRITRDDFAGNILRARRRETQRTIAKLRAPLNRDAWDISVPTNNAYYDPQNNDIVFPAGILQPPFFDPTADAATNYGSIGATIGHELTHGFDNSGRTFDADGLLRDWWTPVDNRNYNARTNKLVTQYNAFEPLPGVRLNGRQTLDENIADLGGLKIAYRAWKATEPAAPTPVDGLTAEQRFFVAYAQSWRTRERKAALKLQVAVDVHSTAFFRVNGPVADLPEFAAAFGCAPGTPMVIASDRRPEVW